MQGQDDSSGAGQTSLTAAPIGIPVELDELDAPAGSGLVRLAGTGRLEFSGGTLCVAAKADGSELAGALVGLATAPFVLRFVSDDWPLLFPVVAAATLIGGGIYELRRRRRILIDCSVAGAMLDPVQRRFRIELPDGRWLSGKTGLKSVKPLRVELRRLFGDRLQTLELSTYSKEVARKNAAKFVLRLIQLAAISVAAYFLARCLPGLAS